MREGIPPLADGVSAFLDDLLLEGRSPATRHAYAVQLRHVTDWPSPADCRRLLGERMLVSRSSAHLFRAALAAFIRYSQQQGWLYDSPLAGVPRVGVKPPPHRYLTPPQVRTVYAACNDDRDRLIVRLLLLGLRAAELLSVTTAHLEGDVLRVTGKGSKHRAVVVDAETLAMLPAEGRLMPLVYKTLVRRVRALGKRAGIGWLRPHDFRRTWATSFLLETDDARSLQQLGGWASDAMVRRYAKSALEASAVSKARAVNLTGKLLGLKTEAGEVWKTDPLPSQ